MYDATTACTYKLLTNRLLAMDTEVTDHGAAGDTPAERCQEMKDQHAADNRYNQRNDCSHCVVRCEYHNVNDARKQDERSKDSKHQRSTIKHPVEVLGSNGHFMCT
ncbi:hypothetical protein [Chitinivorax sp. B]|uniref:hypothetical protein n=1 Tax=Chitinivorax sp. B TaxID=2502235 RepID=UPI0010F98AA6|nr:hypothetical protein [Chitinivorax sp. B]